MPHRYTLSERYLLLCGIFFNFFFLLVCKGWARGWHSVCRSHEESTGVFRSNHFSVPTYMFFLC
jgi:hypothetical protein